MATGPEGGELRTEEEMGFGIRDSGIADTELTATPPIP